MPLLYVIGVLLLAIICIILIIVAVPLFIVIGLCGIALRITFEKEGF